jgi:peptidoglycan/LPS O-acetylase OafA/YrhL
MRERERTGTLDTRGFYVRRILRIWPLYFAFLTLASVLPFLAKSQHLPLPYILSPHHHAAGIDLLQLAGNAIPTP